MKKFFGKYASSSAIVEDLNNEVLSKPYVALITGSTSASPVTVDYNEEVPTHDYSLDYFTVEALESGAWTITPTYYFAQYADCEVMYSLNNGQWQIVNKEESDGVAVYFNEGDLIRIKVSNYPLDASNLPIFGELFSCSELTNVYGNIMSLFYGDNFSGHTIADLTEEESLFESMFENCNIVSAEHLIIPFGNIGSDGSFSRICKNMFAGSTNLIIGPDIILLNVPEEGFVGMFNGCTSLQHINCQFDRFEGGSDLYKCFEDWTVDVPSGGTFITNPDIEWDTDDTSGIPTGWTRENVPSPWI